MTLPDRHIKILTIVLLVVQLCLPLSAPLYISDLLNNIEKRHTGFVCAHADSDSGKESQGGNQHITHCHELDAPCDTTSALVLDYKPVISTITSSSKGTLLPGYGAPIDIPPENRA